MSNYGETDDMNKILDEGKHLLKLSERYLKLEAIDKLSLLMTILVVSGVVFVLGMSALFFICLGIVKKLTQTIGDEALALFIVGGALLALVLCFVLLRKYLVTNPVIKALARELFGKSRKGVFPDNESASSAKTPSVTD